MAEESGLAEQLTKVLAKNEQLIGEMREKDKLLKQFEGVDLEGLQAAAAKLQEVEDAKKKEVGEYKTLYDQELKKNSKLQSELDASGASNTDLKKRLEVVKSMPEVFPEFREIAINQLSASVEFGDNDSVTAGGKDIKEFMKDWSESPLGKRMIMAGDNSGGNATGSKTGQGPDPMAGIFKKGDPQYSLTEQAKMRKTDPDRAKRLEKQASGG